MQPPFGALTNIFRCRAHTKPSPPLLPGPQSTSTAGGLVGKESGGYAWRRGGALGWAGWWGGHPAAPPRRAPTLAMAVAQLSPASSISWSTLNL